MNSWRQRMDEEMVLRGYSRKTRELYRNSAARFESHFGKSPELLGPEEVRSFQLHLVATCKLSASSCNIYACALKFLYSEVLGVLWEVETVRHQRRPKKLPDILSAQELLRLFAATATLKERMLLELTYSAGLRLGEVLGLAPRDIDTPGMRIHIREGKGRRDRYVMLCERLLPELRAYYVEAGKPKVFLFEGSRAGQPLSRTAAQAVVRRASRTAGIHKHVTMHTLRHCFATHLLQDGTDLRRIQLLLGHSCMSTTALYLRLGGEQIHATASPLDRLKELQSQGEGDAGGAPEPHSVPQAPQGSA